MYRIQIGQIGGSQSAKKLVLGAITKKINKKYNSELHKCCQRGRSIDPNVSKYYNLISWLAICTVAWMEIKYFRCSLLSVYGKYLAVYIFLAHCITCFVCNFFQRVQNSFGLLLLKSPPVGLISALSTFTFFEPKTKPLDMQMGFQFLTFIGPRP